MLKDILTNIRNPSPKYRGIPFWSWNDRLDPEELRWQVREMKEAGLGGYFMHARAGLRTPYMEEEWMQCVEACIDEGNQQGMDSWIYDENGYPSGFAAEKIPSMGEEYQQKFLKFEIVMGEMAVAGSRTLGFYRITGDCKRIDPADIKPGESVLHAYYQINPYYTDMLDEKTVRKFIESVYDVYYERFKEHFGKGVPGIFTDEPQYGRTAMPWSLIIPLKFEKRYGYGILDHLSALYFKTPGYRKVRYDFWNLVTELFTGAVARQLAEWCEKHGCKLTGHILLEEDIRYQTMCSGSAMGFYRYMQVPGIDWLGRTIGNPVIVKQVASVGEQLEKECILSEMFAAAGWSTSLEELKRIAEWQYSLGVNVICAHLEGYSLRGLRKRDHPPGLFYQTNWWKEYSKFNNYFARLGMLLAEGENAARILVIHPLRSGWIALDDSCYKNGTNAELAHIDDSFTRLSEILSSLHLDYHYGDEEIIAGYGSIKDGAFIIGNCSYRAVVIPPATTLEPDTVRLLRGFIEGGGKVFAFQEFPFMIRGVETEELKTLKKRCIQLNLQPEDILEKLEAAACKEISVLDKNGREIDTILHKARYYQDGSVIYLLNIDDTRNCEAEIKVPGNGNCYAVSLEDCNISRLLSTKSQGMLKFRASFAPCQSHVIVITDEPLSSIQEADKPLKSMHTLQIGDVWKSKVCGLNAITLDYCRVSIENGEWSEFKPVITVQKELLDLGRSTDIALEFKVNSKYSFGSDKEMYLVIEDAGKYLPEINGKPVQAKPEGWWKDKSFYKIDICGMLAEGTNTIILRTHFYSSQETLDRLERAKVFEAEMNMISFDSELESIYLLGEFTVTGGREYISSSKKALIQQGGFQLDEPCEQECSGELSVCGYPFYSGSALLEQDIELETVENFSSMIFKMDRPNAALSKLYVNGIEAKTFLWAPYEAEIRPYVRNGANRITLELVSTDRNLFGPHHHPDGELYNLGPQHFTDALGWSEDYCFICFGIEGKPFIQCYVEG